MTTHLSAAQSRNVDRYAIDALAVPGAVLMENAGRGAVQEIIGLAMTAVIKPARFIILTGSGNNAGDGFVVARHLDCAGLDVLIAQATPTQRLSGDARLMADIAGRLALPTIDASNPDGLIQHIGRHSSPVCFVDALMGTGAVGAPRPHFARLIDVINQTRAGGRALTVALDLPSGLDADTGVASEPTVAADLTLTFGTLKTGFQNPDAARWTGPVRVVSLGIPRRAIEASLQA